MDDMDGDAVFPDTPECDPDDTPNATEDTLLEVED